MKKQNNKRVGLVGEMMPYVFIESVSIESGVSLRAEDNVSAKTNETNYVKNEFGNNKPQTTTQNTQNMQETYSATLTISINDFLNNSVWFNTPARRLMKIKLLKATSKKAYDVIKSRNFYDASKAPRALKDHISETVLDIPVIKDLRDYAVTEIENHNDALCTIKLKKQFVVSKEFLGFVAFAYFETPEMFGPKNHCRVAFDGRIDTKSYTFYSPDGTQWRGPIHRHPDKGIMEGRRHSEIPHNVLTVVEHSNKVKDYRIFDKFREHQDQITFKDTGEQRGKVYSDLLLSADTSGIVRGFFAFDMVKYLKQNSEFSGLVNKRNLKKLMYLSRIEELTIFRDAISDFEGGETIESNLIRTASRPRDIIASYTPPDKRNRKIHSSLKTVDEDRDGIPEKTIGSVSELDVTGLGNKRGFSFADIEMATKGGGTYLYGANITIQDPTVNLFKTQFFALREARKIIMSYAELAKSKNNYDPNTGDFSYAFLNDLKIKNNLSINIKGKGAKSASVPWRIAPKIYFSALEVLLGQKLPKTSKKGLQKLLYPSTGNLRGVDMFVRLIDDLLKKMENTQKFATEASQGNNITKGFLNAAGAQRPSSIETSLKTENRFTKTPWRATKYNQSSYKINYFDGLTERTQFGLTKINRNSLLSRFNVEAGKYFPEIVGKKESQVSDSLLNNFRSVYNSYLSPSSLASHDGKISLIGQSKKSYQQAEKILRSGNLTAQALDEMGLLSALGATVSVRNSKNSVNYATNTKNYFGDNTNFDSKLENKDSGRDAKTYDLAKDKTPGNIIDAILQKKQKSNDGTASKNSLQERYISKITNEGGLDDLASEVSVLQQTTVAVRYLIGFDENMRPVYTTKVPHSADSSIYILDSYNNSLGSGEQLYLVSDSVGVVQTGGLSLSVDDITSDKELDEIPMSLRRPRKSGRLINSEDPCPDGYQYNLELNACVLIEGARIEAVSLDEADPVTEDVQYGLGQYFQSPDSLSTRSSSSRRRSGNATQTTATPAPPSTPQATTRSTSTATVSSGGGGGGSYGY